MTDAPRVTAVQITPAEVERGGRADLSVEFENAASIKVVAPDGVYRLFPVSSSSGIETFTLEVFQGGEFSVTALGASAASFSPEESAPWIERIVAYDFPPVDPAEFDLPFNTPEIPIHVAAPGGAASGIDDTAPWWSNREQPSKFSAALAYIGGARRDALAWQPGASSQYVGTALVLAFTAAMAGVSASAALTIALHPPVWMTALLAVFWASLIFNLDRLFVVTMAKEDGWLILCIGAFARVLIAGCLAVVISTPLTLLILHKEVAHELEAIDLQQLNEYKDQLASEHGLVGLKSDLAKVQSDLRKTRLDPDTEAALKQLRGAVALDQKRVSKAQAEYTEEADGTGGTHSRGCRSVCAAKKNVLDGAQQNLEADRQALTDAENQADEVSGQRTGDLRANEQRLSAQIDKITTGDAEKASQFAADAADSHGILAQVQALWALGEKSPAAFWTHVFLFLLFFFVELLPITMKTLALVRPKTAYEEAVTVIDAAGLQMLRDRRDVVLDAADETRKAELSTTKKLNQEISKARVRILRRRLKAAERKAMAEAPVVIDLNAAESVPTAGADHE